MEGSKKYVPLQCIKVAKTRLKKMKEQPVNTVNHTFRITRMITMIDLSMYIQFHRYLYRQVISDCEH